MSLPQMKYECTYSLPSLHHFRTALQFLYLPLSLFLPGGLLRMRRKIGETLRASGNCCQYRLTCVGKRLAVSIRTCYMHGPSTHVYQVLGHSHSTHTRRQKTWRQTLLLLNKITAYVALFPTASKMHRPILERWSQHFHQILYVLKDTPDAQSKT